MHKLAEFQFAFDDQELVLKFTLLAFDLSECFHDDYLLDPTTNIVIFLLFATIIYEYIQKFSDAAIFGEKCAPTDPEAFP